MSDAHHVAHGEAGHGGSHGTLKSYLAGFGLSLALTLLSFGCVMTGMLPHDLVMPGLVVFCVAQLVVQLVFFLHLNTSRAERGNLAIMLSTLVILAIIVVGSLWVLHNMNANMMHPTSQMVPVE